MLCKVCFKKESPNSKANIYCFSYIGPLMMSTHVNGRGGLTVTQFVAQRPGLFGDILSLFWLARANRNHRYSADFPR